MCTCGICGKPFPSHTALADHIFRDHANRLFAAILAAAIIALATLMPVKADSTQPPSVGEPPSVAVEHRLYLPFVASDNGVKAAVSWCPSCSPRR